MLPYNTKQGNIYYSLKSIKYNNIRIPWQEIRDPEWSRA